MKVNVINGNSNDIFRALVYTPPDQGMINYMQSTFNTAKEYIGDKTSNFISNAQSLYNNFNSDVAIMKSKNLLNQASVHVSEDMIYKVNHNSIHNANLEMQQWIMEEPNVQRLYQKQMLDGYSTTYYDYSDSNIPPKERTQYMQVVNDVISCEAYGSLDGAHYVYSEDDRKDITEYDRMSILDSWMVARDLICDDIDPTELK